MITMIPIELESLSEQMKMLFLKMKCRFRPRYAGQ